MKTVTLAELRAINGKTQVQVARTMKVSQSMVAQIESKSDMRVSTLRNYVEALGYKLEISATFGKVSYLLDIGPRSGK